MQCLEAGQQALRHGVGDSVGFKLLGDPPVYPHGPNAFVVSRSRAESQARQRVAYLLVGGLLSYLIIRRGARAPDLPGQWRGGAQANRDEETELENGEGHGRSLRV